MSHPFPFRKVYGPAAAVITLYGLLSALLGDGLWDELSWVALAVPLVVIVWIDVVESRSQQTLEAIAEGEEGAHVAA